jgi:hypothetical protein
VNDRDNFIRLLKKYPRQGLDELISFLDNNNFFDYPASIKYHGVDAGGLCKHSLNLHNLFFMILNRLNFDYDDKLLENIVYASLLHDICKLFYYKKINESYEYRKNKKTLKHGELSVAIVEKFIKLEEREKQLIKFHMGYYQCKEFMSEGEYKLSELCKAQNDKIIKLFHYCDDLSAQFLEK